MARKSSKRRRTTTSYKTAVKNLRDIVPALHKIDLRRKLTRANKRTLKRWEQKVGSRADLFKLTKTQLKSLGRKHPALISPNIKAIRLRNTSADARIHIDHGKLNVISAARQFHSVTTAPTIDALLNAAERVFARHKRAQVWLWLNAGRQNQGHTSARRFAEYLAAKLATYKQIEMWINGIMYVTDFAQLRKT